MEKIKQDNFLGGQSPSGESPSGEITTSSIAASSQSEEPARPEATQFVLPQEALNRIDELERQYREIVERENI